MFAFRSNIRPRLACMRTSWKTDFRLNTDFRSSKNKFRGHDISQGLDWKPPSLSPHFLLIHCKSLRHAFLSMVPTSISSDFISHIYAHLNTECTVWHSLKRFCNFCFCNLQMIITNAANKSGKRSDNRNQKIHKMKS